MLRRTTGWLWAVLIAVPLAVSAAVEPTHLEVAKSLLKDATADTRAPTWLYKRAFQEFEAAWKERPLFSTAYSAAYCAMKADLPEKARVFARLTVLGIDNPAVELGIWSGAQRIEDWADAELSARKRATEQPVVLPAGRNNAVMAAEKEANPDLGGVVPPAP